MEALSHFNILWWLLQHSEYTPCIRSYSIFYWPWFLKQSLLWASDLSVCASTGAAFDPTLLEGQVGAHHLKMILQMRLQQESKMQLISWLWPQTRGDIVASMWYITANRLKHTIVHYCLAAAKCSSQHIKMYPPRIPLPARQVEWVGFLSTTG